MSIIDTLLGAVNPAKGAGFFPTGVMTTPPINAPVDPMGGLPTEDVFVSALKPKKRNLLEILGDAVLIHGGMSPMFAQNKKEDNLQAAMEGFTTEPLEAIRRIAQVDPKAAWTLYNQHQDNVRADEQAASLRDDRRERGYNRIGAMLGAARPETWEKMRPVIERYAQSRGIDVADLPTEYDPDALDVWRMGSLSVDDQEDNLRDSQYKGARLGQYQQGIDNTERYRQARLGQHDRSLAIREEKAKQKGGKEAPASGARMVETGFGPGEYSPDGTQLRVKISIKGHPDEGKYVRYRKDANGDFKRIN